MGGGCSYEVRLSAFREALNIPFRGPRRSVARFHSNQRQTLVPVIYAVTLGNHASLTLLRIPQYRTLVPNGISASSIVCSYARQPALLTNCHYWILSII
jgi:hypothetical protein